MALDTMPACRPRTCTGRSKARSASTIAAPLQRGFQVYKEVCSACHSLNRVAFHNLDEPGGPGFTEAAGQGDRGRLQDSGRPNDKGETVDDKGIR